MKADLVHNIENFVFQKRDIFLVKETLAGKKDSFARLMALYQKRVEALGMSFFHNREDTEDFVQDVFLKAYSKLDTFRGESRFSTWLTRIAYTTAINTKSRRKETNSLLDEDILISEMDSPEQTELRRVTEQAVQEAVKNLPENYRACMTLYFFLQTPYDEIAVITGLPVNTIKSHIFRAKKILREKLRDYKYNHL